MSREPGLARHSTTGEGAAFYRDACEEGRDEEKVQSPTKIISKGELQFFNKPKLLSTFPKCCKSSLSHVIT